MLIPARFSLSERLIRYISEDIPTSSLLFFPQTIQQVSINSANKSFSSLIKISAYLSGVYLGGKKWN